MTIVSLREAIIAKNDIPIESVEVPEWGVTIEVRGMNGADRAAILNNASEAEDGATVGGMFIDVVLATAFDPDTGQRIFTDADRDIVQTKAAAALERISSVGMRLSGMTAEAKDDAKRQFPEESTEAVPV